MASFQKVTGLARLMSAVNANNQIPRAIVTKRAHSWRKDSTKEQQAGCDDRVVELIGAAVVPGVPREENPDCRMRMAIRFPIARRPSPKLVAVDSGDNHSPGGQPRAFSRLVGRPR
jgi:hypothetical protein